MSLQDEIDQKRREIRTDGYSMSIGEWITLYRDGELDIHPEFQRLYRWTEVQKTHLIESILLGIPLPPIFVSQRQDGVWDVVDGVQRLSTIFQLLGILKDDQDSVLEPLTLQATKYLPSLAGMRWDASDMPDKSLPHDAKLSFKRSKIAVNIILKESDGNAKYDLFERLNTGGSELSPQEVRNCLLVMLNKRFFNWMRELAQHGSFKEVCALSENSLDEAYDIELVLRFMVLYKLPEEALKNVGDVGVFLTEQMRKLVEEENFPYESSSQVFKETFDELARTVGDLAFKRFSVQKGRHEGGFLLSQYEVVALGMAFNISSGTLVPVELLPEKIQSIWSSSEYTGSAGSGIRASGRLPRIVPFGRRHFSK